MNTELPPIETEHNLIPAPSGEVQIESAIHELTLADGRPIPSTWPELLPLLNEFGHAQIPEDKAEKKLHLARHAEIKRRAFQQQQATPAPAPPMTANEQVEASLHRLHGDHHRSCRRKVLEAFMARPAPELTTIAPYDFKIEPRARLAIEPEVLVRLWRCRQAIAQHEIFEIDNFDLAHPVNRIAELDRAISRADNLAAVRELLAEIAVLNQPQAKANASSMAHKAIGQSLHDATKEISVLIELCRSLLHSWRQEAEKKENEFFGKSKLPPQRTLLSKRFETTERTLPPASRNSLAWFGVKDIAAL